MKKLLSSLAIVVLAFALSLNVFAAKDPGGDGSQGNPFLQNEHVDFCHEASNGHYTSPGATIKSMILDSGNGGHAQDANDIIPSFWYLNDEEVAIFFPGLNLNTIITGNITGQDVLDNGCEVPEEEEPVDVCPNIPDNQSEVPPGMHIAQNGDCVQDEVPPPSTSTVTLCKKDDQGNLLSGWNLKFWSNGNNDGHDYTDTTDEDGCVTFQNVPFGSFTVGEILQDGWNNVSGLGAVTVDEPTETFTVVNHHENEGCTQNCCTEDCGDPVDACPNEDTDPGFQQSGPCNNQDICPNIGGIQTVLPDNMVVNGDGNCVERTDETPSADLEISKDVNDQSVDQGQEVTYTVNVTNHGPDSATNVTVTDALPSGLSFVSANATMGSYDENTNIWTVGTLTLNQTVTLTMVATVTGSENDVIVNGADVTMDPDIDINTGNDHDEISITVNEESNGGGGGGGGSTHRGGGSTNNSSNDTQGEVLGESIGLPRTDASDTASNLMMLSISGTILALGLTYLTRKPQVE